MRGAAAACLLAAGASGLAIPALTLKRASTGDPVDLRAAVANGSGRTLVVYGARLRTPQPREPCPPPPPLPSPSGTYAADFNMIEYAQQARHYWPELQTRGVSRALIIVNSPPAAAAKLGELLDLPDELELLSDEAGEAGRAFAVGRGWLPDTTSLRLGGSGVAVPLSPYVKLLGMLVGLGASGTLPSVIAGYFGNPSGVHGWIESGLAQGATAGRWPSNAVEVDGASRRVTSNKFDELLLVSGWGRRPLELATLRLQNMVGLSLAHWDQLKPTDDRCLTQLGGCAIYAPGEPDTPLFEWRDNGICGVANFARMIKALPRQRALAAVGGTVTRM
jgi:hypothetical protein